MAVPTVMNDLSATASSNSPAGTDTIGTSLDDYMRAAYAILRHTNAKGADIASSTTTDIGAATGEFVDVTGTTTITGFGTVGAGITRVVRFTGALTLTYNASSMILPGSSSIRTSNGDIGVFRSLGSGNWICTSYMPISMLPNVQVASTTYGAYAGGSVNLSLAASAAAGALTVSIKTFDGNDPSVASPTRIFYRGISATNGQYAVRTLTAAQSITIPSGATLGVTTANKPFRIWVLWLEGGGSNVSIGVINTLNPTSLAIFPLGSSRTGLTATTIGAGSDSPHVIYADGNVTSSFSIKVLGWIEYGSGLATPGTWTAASKIHNQGYDDPLPGDVVQYRHNSGSAQATGTTTIPSDDTIPQNTEGDEYITASIAPASAANVLRIQHVGMYTHSTTTSALIGALFQDSTADALSAIYAPRQATANAATALTLTHVMRADTTSTTTFKIRVGASVAGTTAFNGTSATRFLGGVMGSHLDVTELMA